MSPERAAGARGESPRRHPAARHHEDGQRTSGTHALVGRQGSDRLLLVPVVALVDDDDDADDDRADEGADVEEDEANDCRSDGRPRRFTTPAAAAVVPVLRSVNDSPRK